jgi:hypothetical protein
MLRLEFLLQRKNKPFHIVFYRKRAPMEGKHELQELLLEFDLWFLPWRGDSRRAQGNSMICFCDLLDARV